MVSMVRWNLQDLGSIISSLERERSNLADGLQNMRTQKDRVGVNWQSAAGRQYQDRLHEDIADLEAIVSELEARIGALGRVRGHYEGAEQSIERAAARLP